jgi:hypothetical protein
VHPPRTAGMGSDSVFAGVFELDDANGICGLVMSPEDLLDALASLVDKSILIREEWGTTVCSGCSRRSANMAARRRKRQPNSWTCVGVTTTGIGVW